MAPPCLRHFSEAHLSVVSLMRYSQSTPCITGRCVYIGVSLWNVCQSIQLFRERLSEKNIKVHMTRPKGGLGIHWNFAYRPRGNLQVCIFACGEFVFPLRRPISVALLLLLHVFE